MLAASCTSAGGDAPAAAPPETTTTVTQSETAPLGDLTTSTTSASTSASDGEAPAETAPSVAGPPAPDFSLVLGDGGDFTLSDEQKPVYLVFWAEW